MRSSWLSSTAAVVADRAICRTSPCVEVDAARGDGASLGVLPLELGDQLVVQRRHRRWLRLKLAAPGLAAVSPQRPEGVHGTGAQYI
jgi:hypothetical protein